ncbi:GCN5-related N-acetyltransferase [Xylariales sp. PMI_506]|nr:GCN5-related N-acetyltransferase [Xylariales sp. PMI_506]
MPNSAATTENTITLREINETNWRAVVELTVLEEQKGNVSSNLLSLCESHYATDAWVRAIYADDTPVGFLMMSICDTEQWYAIWRFMIDHRYQASGYGKAAVKLAIAHIREHHPQAKLIRLMSTGPNGKKDVKARYSPYYFYSSLGWKDISKINEDGQVEMGLNL